MRPGVKTSNVLTLESYAGIDASKRCALSTKIKPGDRFGSLVVVRQSDIRVVQRTSGGKLITSHLQFECVCDCGKPKITRGSFLTSLSVISCGCKGRDLWRASVKGAHDRKRLPPGEAAFRATFLAYRLSAKKKKISFSITPTEFLELALKNCHYCGEPPSNIFVKSGCVGHYEYNGIDRVDNNLGYESGNLVPCCADCNIGKSDREVHRFLTWVDAVYLKHFNEG
jgi:hypothetical protein